MKEYVIPTDEEKRLIESLKDKNDTESLRIKRYLSMPDLSRTPDSPLFDMVERVKSIQSIKNFDVINIPEVIPTNILFDLFDFATDHPARSKSDTYYIDDTHVLRTHDTVMWHYFLNLNEIKQKIAQQEKLGVFCYGKVYRKDEIDRRHMNIFHQMGGLFLQPDTLGIMPIDELKKVLSEIVEGIFGKETKYRFLEDTFPYTDPSLQIEIEIGGEWVEIMGGGMPKKSVLKKMGVEGYNGWAFGFGLERLAIISMELPDIRLLWSEDERVKKQLKLGQKYKEVSKYPPVVRDISFVASKDFSPNDFFDLIREVAGDELMEEVKLLDQYENDEKFGADKKSYAFRIVYRSLERTLTSEEVDALHKKLETQVRQNFKAVVR